MAAYWICAIFTLISACLSLGYSLSAVKVANVENGIATRYTLARSIGLVVISIVPLTGERHDWLVAAATAMIVVQAADALVGAGIKDRVKTFGPAATATINLALLLWYVGSEAIVQHSGHLTTGILHYPSRSL